MIPDDIKRTIAQRNVYDDEKSDEDGVLFDVGQSVSNIAQPQTSVQKVNQTRRQQQSPVLSSMTSTNKVSKTLYPEPQAVRGYGQGIGVYIDYKPTEYVDSSVYKGVLDRYVDRIKNPDEPFMASLADSLIDPQDAQRKQQVYDERRKKYGAIVSLAEMLASGIDAIGAQKNAFTIHRTPNRTYSEDTFREQARLDQQARMAQDLYLRAKESDRARQDREYHQAAGFVSADQNRRDQRAMREYENKRRADEFNANMADRLNARMTQKEQFEMNKKIQEKKMAQDNAYRWAHLNMQKRGEANHNEEIIKLPTGLRNATGGGIMGIRMPKRDEARIKEWLYNRGKEYARKKGIEENPLAIFGKEEKDKTPDYINYALSDPTTVLQLAQYTGDVEAVGNAINLISKMPPNQEAAVAVMRAAGIRTKSEAIRLINNTAATDEQKEAWVKYINTTTRTPIEQDTFLNFD